MRRHNWAFWALRLFLSVRMASRAACAGLGAARCGARTASMVREAELEEDDAAAWFDAASEDVLEDMRRVADGVIVLGDMVAATRRPARRGGNKSPDQA